MERPQSADPSTRGRIPVVVIAFLAIFALRFAAAPLIVGDTSALVTGARSFENCVSDGALGDCPEGSVFAPLQYLPALALIDFRLSDPQVQQGLAALSLAAFIGLVLITRHMFAGTRRWLAPLALFFVLSGPLLWYAGTSFSETLATSLMVGLVAALIRRAPWPVIALLAFGACISKDIAAPFLAVLVVVALFAPEGSNSVRATRGRLIPAVAGIAAGVMVVGAANLARWGTLTNGGYANDQYRVPGVGLRAELSSALWWSPAGGVVAFWPLAALIVVAVCAVAIARLRSTRRRHAWPQLALLASLLVLTVGLGGWYAPFGWVAWGPRLMLPVLTATLLLALYVSRPELERWLSDSAGMWVLVVVGSLGVLVAMTHLAAMLNPTAYQGPTDLPATICIEGRSDANVDPSAYYDCLKWIVWRSEPAGLRVVRELELPPTALALFVALALALWTLLAGAVMAARSDHPLRTR